MKIALLGGTGDVGEGLALRWAYDTNHEIVVGSRDPERARAKADEYETELDSRGVEVAIDGRVNGEAVVGGDVVVLSVPAYHLTDTVQAVGDGLDGQILVSPAVGMQRREGGMHYNPPGAGSVTALAVRAAPPDTPVVGAFHGLAAGRLANLDVDLDADVPIVGDDADAKGIVADLTDGIEGLRALDAGPVENAPEVESLTPLLVNLAMHNDDLHDVLVTFD